MKKLFVATDHLAEAWGWKHRLSRDQWDQFQKETYTAAQKQPGLFEKVKGKGEGRDYPNFGLNTMSMMNPADLEKVLHVLGARMITVPFH